MREQTLILMSIDTLKRRLVEAITLEQDHIGLKQSHVDIETAKRDAEIDRREQQLRDVYFPLIQSVEKEIRPAHDHFPFGPRLYRTKIDGEGSFFAILLDEDLHERLSSGGYHWFEHMKQIASFSLKPAVVEYHIKTTDLPKPRLVSDSRLARLQSHLDWVEKLPSDPDDCLVTEEQARFLGFDLEYGSFHYYRVMPE